MVQIEEQLLVLMFEYFVSIEDFQVRRLVGVLLLFLVLVVQIYMRIGTLLDLVYVEWGSSVGDCAFMLRIII